MRATAWKSQGCVLRVNCRMLCTAALPAQLAKPGVNVGGFVPAATSAIPPAPFYMGGWVLLLGGAMHLSDLAWVQGEEELIAAIPDHTAPSLSTAERTLLFFPSVKPDGWQVLTKTEPDISREHAAPLPLQAHKSRVEKCPSTAMQPSVI